MWLLSLIFSSRYQIPFAYFTGLLCTNEISKTKSSVTYITASSRLQNVSPNNSLCRVSGLATVIIFQWPLTRSFDVFYDLCLNKRMSKQSFIHAQIKENIKAPSHWLCVGNSPVAAQRASNAEKVSIWWRHHVKSPEKIYHDKNDQNIDKHFCMEYTIKLYKHMQPAHVNRKAYNQNVHSLFKW